MRIKSLEKYKLLLGVIFLYLILGTVIIYHQYSFMTNYQYTSLGENALNLAEVAVKSMHITNAEVEELENISFEESQSHPLNKQLEELFRLVEKNNSIKYVYVVRALSPDKVKYEVDESDTEFYGLPVGTKLDYIWLLDVVVDAQQKIVVEASPSYYQDKNRYTSNRSAVIQESEDKTAKYMYSESEWGTGISGVAPLYTVEGEYIGLLGVDMYSESFDEYRTKIFWELLILIMIPTIFTSGIFLYLHFSYRKKMNTLAFRDQLTGVYNRRYFDKEGETLFRTAQKENKSIGVVIGDIDDFKRFNDEYGHQDGDLALQSVASVMENFLKVEKGFVARYGGEEFVIVLDNPEDLEGVCQKICTAISKTDIQHSNNMSTHVTISLGAYKNTPKDGESFEEFIKKADDAMYQAKKSGKNTFTIG